MTLVPVITLIAWAMALKEAEAKTCARVGILAAGETLLLSNVLPSVTCNNDCEIEMYKIYNNQATNEITKLMEKKTNFAMMVEVGMPARMSKMVTQIVDAPLLSLKPVSCKESVCPNQASITVSKKSLAKAAKAVILQNQWSKVAVLYHDSKADEARAVSMELDNTVRLSLHSLPHTTDGSLDKASLGTLTFLTDSTIDLFVVIYPSHNMQYFFDKIYSTFPEAKALQLKFLLLLPVESLTLRMEKLPLVLAFWLDKYISPGPSQILTNQLSQSQLNTMQLSDALVLDSLTLAFKATCSILKQQGENGSFTPTEVMIGLKQQADELKMANNLVLNLIKVLENIGCHIKDEAKTSFNGLTGNVKIGADSYRQGVTLALLNLRENTLAKIGDLSDTGTYQLSSQPQANYINVNPFAVLERPLKIVTKLEEPFIYKDVNTGELVGFLVDILKALESIYTFTYTIYEVPDREYGYKNNSGTWKGIIGELVFKRADLGLAPVVVNEERGQAVQFTKSFMELDVAYVRQRPIQTVKLFLFLEPYTSIVWSITLMTVFVFASSLFIIQLLADKKDRAKRKEMCERRGIEFFREFLEISWYAIGCILQQGGERGSPTMLSGRILTGCFWFCSLIVIASYTANLAAYFTFEKTKAEQKSLDELLKEDSHFSLYKNTAIDSYVKSSSHRTYKLLYERVTSFQQFVNSIPEGVTKVRKEENLIFLEEASSLQWIVNKQPCDLKAVPGIFKVGFLSLPVRKNSPIEKAISDGMVKLHDSGFIQARRNYYWTQLNQCNSTDQDNAEKSSGSVRPEQLFGVFIILVAGVACSLFALAGEIKLNQSKISPLREPKEAPSISDEIARQKAGIIL